jgi:hypothetical protein
MSFNQGRCQICEVKQPVGIDLSSKAVGMKPGSITSDIVLVQGTRVSAKHKGKRSRFDYLWLGE